MDRENQDVIRCDSCSEKYSSDEVVELLGKRVCAKCKPDAVMAIKSGTRPAFLDERSPFSREDAEALDRKVLPLIEQADQPPDTTDQPGKFRRRPMILFLLTAASIMLLVTVYRGLAELGVVLGFVFGSIWLLAIGNDLYVPSPRDRSTLGPTIICFFRGLRYGHWRKAWSCLTPLGLATEAASPRVNGMKVSPTLWSFETLSGFKKYWMAFTRPTNSESISW